MDHAFVLLINRTGTDITAILVFKLELNKCFALSIMTARYTVIVTHFILTGIPLLGV